MTQLNLPPFPADDGSPLRARLQRWLVPLLRSDDREVLELAGELQLAVALLAAVDELERSCGERQVYELSRVDQRWFLARRCQQAPELEPPAHSCRRVARGIGIFALDLINGLPAFAAVLKRFRYAARAIPH